MAENTLYDRVGGEAALVAFFDKFYPLMTTDERVSSQFQDTDIDRLKRE